MVGYYFTLKEGAKMKDRPQMELLGMDGNIFFVMGSASRLLKRAGLYDESKEMFERVQSSHDYYTALGVISEYVYTEISNRDPGIIEADDIRIDSDLIADEKGVTAYIETWFDVKRRFGVELNGDASLDLYATVKPDTGALNASIVISREPGDERECIEVTLLPCERKLITEGMETIEKEHGTSLKAHYEGWMRGYGNKKKEPNKNKEKNSHER